MPRPLNILSRLIALRDLAVADISKTQQLIGLLVAIWQAESLSERVKRAVEALVILSDLTPNESDDKLAALAKQMLDAGAIDVLVDLVERLLLGSEGESAAMGADALVAGEALAGRLQVDFAKLLELAMLIVKLLS